MKRLPGPSRSLSRCEDTLKPGIVGIVDDLPKEAETLKALRSLSDGELRNRLPKDFVDAQNGAETLDKSHHQRLNHWTAPRTPGSYTYEREKNTVIILWLSDCDGPRTNVGCRE